MLHRRLRSLALVAFLASNMAPVQAADRALEYTVKAGYLYKFLKFVEWPQLETQDDRQPIVICILGEDPFGELLDPIEHETAQGRRLSLVRIQHLADDARCHVLFISDSADRNEILSLLLGKSILTVGDTEGFALSGGMIGFVTKARTVRLEINPDAARKAGLRIHSNLLEVARIVRPSKVER